MSEIVTRLDPPERCHFCHLKAPLGWWHHNSSDPDLRLFVCNVCSMIASGHLERLLEAKVAERIGFRIPAPSLEQQERLERAATA